jgi:hypothetical protein
MSTFKNLNTCSHRKNIKTQHPELSASENPACDIKMGEKALFNHKNGYSRTESGYQCNLCDYTAKRSGDVQQHCLKHFPGRYPCQDCGDVFHISTQRHNHYDTECLDCGKKVKRGTQASHVRSCKKTKRITTGVASGPIILTKCTPPPIPPMPEAVRLIGLVLSRRMPPPIPPSLQECRRIASY